MCCVRPVESSAQPTAPASSLVISLSQPNRSEVCNTWRHSGLARLSFAQAGSRPRMPFTWTFTYPSIVNWKVNLPLPRWVRQSKTLACLPPCHSLFWCCASVLVLITLDSNDLFTVYFLKQTWLGVSSFSVLIFEFLAGNTARGRCEIHAHWINQSGNLAGHFCQKTISSKDNSVNNIYKSFQNNSVCVPLICGAVS